MRVDHLADGISVYNTDCVELLHDFLHVDHVITDPPYEERMQQLHAEYRLRRTDGGSQRRKLSFDSIADIRDPFLDHIARINRGWLLAFCNVEGVAEWRAACLERDIKFKTTCAWIKPDATPKLNGQGPALGFECFITAWCGSGHARWNGGGRRGVFTYPTNNPDRSGEHETEKPLGLMRECVSLFSDPGESVLDPFMGSGTTGVACVRLGRGFIGIEKNEKFFDLARRRIDAALRQGDMFTERPKKMKQTGMSFLKWRHAMDDLFGPPDAKTARDDALRRVASNGGNWRNNALASLVLISGFEGTAEDIRIRLLMKNLPAPHHHNAWGEFIKAALTSKRLQPTGAMRNMKSTKSHARKTPVYRVV